MFHTPDPTIAEPVGNPESEPAAFLMDSPFDQVVSLFVLSGRLQGWEYCQVTAPERCPTWDEMKAVKDLFWDAEDCCLQLHPPQSRYINKSVFSLWVWRPTDSEIPQPPLHRESNKPHNTKGLKP